jgi:histidinol-phosphate/aromatic aminotransferase/cobyric acid decarboxylase-like protein
MSGWGLPGVVRISFGLHAENVRCLDALTAIVSAH